ncbi:MAG: hypothetical protein WCH34_04895 [Bacteroidota bacterium]
MKKVLLVKIIALFSVMTLLSSCGLSVKSESSVKKFLCKHAFSYWLDNKEEQGAASTYTFKDDGTFEFVVSGGDRCSGKWSLGPIEENLFISRVIELHYTGGNCGESGSAKANLMEDEQVLNVGGKLVYHVDKRY